MTDMGFSRDQSLLALIHAGWSLGAISDHVYTVTERRRPTAKKCRNGCGNLTGTSVTCCSLCEGPRGPHTRHCKDAQVKREELHEEPPEPEAQREAPPENEPEVEAAAPSAV